jgi:alkylated DNA repair protein alkB family protein 7
MHLTSWPSDDAARLLSVPNAPRLSSAIARLHNLFASHLFNRSFDPKPEEKPSTYIQTHLLHLGTSGAIDPHVDHIDASGSVIMGVSLGAPRIMRMTRRNKERTCAEGAHVPDAFEVLLLPGSVYIQRYSASPFTTCRADASS